MAEWNNKSFRHAEHPRSFASAITIDKNIYIYGGQVKGKVLNSSLQIDTGKNFLPSFFFFHTCQHVDLSFF